MKFSFMEKVSSVTYFSTNRKVITRLPFQRKKRQLKVDEKDFTCLGFSTVFLPLKNRECPSCLGDVTGVSHVLYAGAWHALTLTWVRPSEGLTGSIKGQTLVRPGSAHL